jgi:hypothetical protein
MGAEARERIGNMIADVEERLIAPVELIARAP